MLETRASAAIIRRAALIFLPLAAIALCVTYLLYNGQANAIRAAAEATERRIIDSAQQHLTQTLSVVLSDVIYIANQDALLTLLDQGSPEALRHLQNEHVAFARSRAVYDHIRYLDATGREIARMNWHDGSPEIVPADRLSDGAALPIFQRTMKLAQGQLFVTDLFLPSAPNTSGRETSIQTVRPTICIGAPVFDRSGQQRGVVIMDYRGQRLVERIRALTNEASNVWLVDSGGNWLIGPGVADGIDAGGSRSFAAAYPAIWRQIGSGADAALLTADAGRFTYSKVTPGDYHPLAAILGIAAVTGPSWIAIVHTPATAIWAQTSELRRYILLTAGALLLLLAAIAFGLATHQTQREEAERRIRMNEARFRDLLETAPDGVIITDSAGRIELVNAQIERLFGFPRHELIGQVIDMLVPARLRSHHAAQRSAYIAAARTRQMGPGLDLRGVRKDGTEFPVSVSLSPTRTDKGLGVFCDIRDMTAHRETERKIQELNRRLQQDNAELESLNRELEAFSYSVSHDLRAPLRAIEGFSQALQEDAGDKLDEVGQSHLNRVRQAARRMEFLIDDLLKLASVSRTDMNKTSVDVTDLAGEILGDLAATDGRRVAEADIAPGLRANADPRLLRIALENLLSNAWKFTAPRAPTTISVGQEMTGSGLAFYVRDNGVGFDMARAGRLFRPFQRLHDGQEFPGMGIGLATAQRVIRRHGGEIWARSTLGEGAIFYFTLR